MFVVFGLAWKASAQTGPFVETSIEPDQVRVGEPATVSLALYVPTWFPSPPDFPSFELPNAITRVPANSARPTSKRIGRETWSGITRKYTIYPMLAGDYRLDQQTIQLTFANPGKDPRKASIQTDEISFRATVPEPAQGLAPYLAGTRLVIERSIDGDPDRDLDAFEIGDALALTYTVELDGMPALFLPELLNLEETPGISAYPGIPRTSEEGATSRRVETITYIVNAGGIYVLPGVELSWWNTEAQTIEQATLADLSISVAGPTLEESNSSLFDYRYGLAALAVVAFILIVLRRSAGDLVNQFQEQRRIYKESERYHWHVLNGALKSNDHSRCYQALLRWVERTPSASGLENLLRQYADDETRAEVENLRRRLFAGGDDSVDITKLRLGLARARLRLPETQVARDVTVLPNLNP
ncbi:MAG: hypothetical protein AAF662_11585 [Pseudomonadota bacterium]